MGLRQQYLKNTVKPEGLLGRIRLFFMNMRHGRVSDWGLAHLERFSPRVIAELGCGSGKNAAKLLAMFPVAKLFGIDHSDLAIQKATKTNRDNVQAKRCRFIKGDVAALPIKAGAVDLVTAFETVYFWPGPLESLKEVHRILKDDGIFMIVNESDGEDEQSIAREQEIEEMNLYTKDALCAYLKEAGFSEVGVDHDTQNHWLCILAQK